MSLVEIDLPVMLVDLGSLALRLPLPLEGGPLGILMLVNGWVQFVSGRKIRWSA